MSTNTQIIIRKEKGLSVIWVSQSFLMKYCDGLSDSYLRRIRCGVSKGDFKNWQWQQIDGVFYYRYDAIPDRNPSRYKSQLPDTDTLIKMSGEKPSASSSIIEEAKEFVDSKYQNYLYAYSQYETSKAILLAKACSFIAWSAEYINAQQIDHRSNAIFQEFGRLVEELDVKYLPKYYRNLKYKILDVVMGRSLPSDQVELPRAGNANAVAHKEDVEIMAWIYQLRSSGANYTNSFIIRKIQAECIKIGKPVPSDRWIGEKMASHQMKYLTSAGRYGENGKYNSRYKANVPQANALFSGDCWELDGTRVNMLPFKSENKDKTRLDSLYIIAVRDVHSGDIVGMHFDVVEDRWSVSNALRNAVENTGYLPQELRYDRFPGHNTQEMQFIFDALSYSGVKLTCVHKASGKARLERWFGTMQTIALQESPFYYGEGVRSNRRTAHRSEEFMKRMKKVAKEVGWDFDKASAEAEMRLENWLNTPYCKWSRKYAHIEQSPRELHFESDKPHVKWVDKSMVAYLFGLKKQLQIRNNGIIRTEIAKQEFIYQIEDYDIISRYGHVLCCYDVSDLSVVHLYELSNKPLKKYLGMAKEVDPVQMYGDDAGHGMGKLIALNSYFDQQREADLSLQVANGGLVEFTLLNPMQVAKPISERVETAYVAKEMGYEDDGADLSHDITDML